MMALLFKAFLLIIFLNALFILRYYLFFADADHMDSIGISYLEKQSRRRHDAERSIEGEIKCDAVALSCLFTNIFFQAEEGFTIFMRNPSQALNYSGFLIQPGIGSPSDYLYLDTWTATGFGGELVEKAQGRLELEKSYSPTRSFHPIVVKGISEYRDIEYDVVDEPTIIFRVLWPKNLFRALYAGAVALYSLYEWNAVAPSALTRIRIALLDNDLPPMDQYSFHTLYQAFNPKESIVVLKDNRARKLFKAAVVGLSRRAILAETEFDFSDNHSSLRMAAFRFYGSLTKRWLSLQKSNQTIINRCNSTGSEGVTLKGRQANELLGLQGPFESLRVILVVRRDSSRQIINFKDLIKLLKDYTISLRVVAFEDYSLREQIEIVSAADLLIAVHGAALSHLFFMRHGATVLELFPFGFKKTIYRNLAGLLGVQYASWQCPRQSCSVPVGKQRSETKVDWESQESKDFWRNQNIIVDLIEFTQVLNLVLKFTKARSHNLGFTKVAKFDISHEQSGKQNKFLMYLPWEQLNNQLVGLKSACAVASFLNRTLVVPPIGYRRPLPEDLAQRLAATVRVFAPREYEWNPFTRYFDPKMLNELPCQTAPFDSFSSLTRQVRVLLMRRLGQSARVNLKQLEDFYFYIAGLEYEKAAAMPVYYPLYFERPDIDYYLGTRYARDRVLCLGTMFWMYSFGSPLEFPARSFQSKLVDPLYRQITSAFHYHPDLIGLSRILHGHFKRGYNAVHLRRGDYGQKCFDEGMGASQEEPILNSCYQRPAYLVRRIKMLQNSQALPVALPVFLATNDPKLGRLQRVVKRMGVRLVRMQDVLERLEHVDRAKFTALDPIDWSILDQLLCINATGFIGNYFSSFTRTIAERRELDGRDSLFF